MGLEGWKIRLHHTFNRPFLWNGGEVAFKDYSNPSGTQICVPDKNQTGDY